jgi:YggT family protein
LNCDRRDPVLSKIAYGGLSTFRQLVTGNPANRTRAPLLLQRPAIPIWALPLAVAPRQQ